jgi:hypothetical protein
VVFFGGALLFEAFLMGFSLLPARGSGNEL